MKTSMILAFVAVFFSGIGPCLAADPHGTHALIVRAIRHAGAPCA
jgi:hypothetical protein